MYMYRLRVDPTGIELESSAFKKSSVISPFPASASLEAVQFVFVQEVAETCMHMLAHEVHAVEGRENVHVEYTVQSHYRAGCRGRWQVVYGCHLLLRIFKSLTLHSQY